MKKQFSLKKQLRMFERELINRTYNECKKNVAETARVLKTDRANLHRKIVKLKIK